MDPVAEALCSRPSQPAIPGNPSSQDDSCNRFRSQRRLDALEQRVHDRLLVAGSQVGTLLICQVTQLADLVQEGGFHPAEAEVESRCARTREGERPRIPALGQPVYRRPSGKRQPEDPGALVECLPRCVVTGAPHHLDGAMFLPADEVAVAPRYDQRQRGRPKARLLELRGVEVTGEMADADHR